METYLVTIGFFAMLMLMMAVGVIFSNKPLKGSCGGVGTECACLEAGTPDACKTNLEGEGEGSDPSAPLKASEGEDGVVRYS
jgi:hypothetical protein